MSNSITAQITTKTALSAGAFDNSIGVNTHLAFTNSPYNNVTQVASAINYLGVDHVRDMALATNSINTLMAAGIKFDFAPTLASDGTVNVAAFINTLVAFETKYPGSIAAIEGANEVNNWQVSENGVKSIASAALLQQQIYTAVKATPSLANISIYNTTIGSTDTSQFTQLGNLSNYTDYANEHAYVMSTTNISAGLDYLLPFASISAPGKPLVITEAGYTTLTSYWYDGVSETVQAKYTLNTLMDAFQKGVSQTYLYELFDENFGANSAQSHFGLFNADGTPKPVATAIHNLTSILSDPGGTAANVSGSLSFGLTGMPTSGQDMVLAKHNGTMDLVLWAEPVLWNQTTASSITAPTSSVTVTFGSIEAVVKVYDPLNGATPIATYFNVSQIQLGVSDHPVVIEVDPFESVASDVKTYTGAVLTGETTTYVAGSADLSDTKVFSATGVLTRETIVHTDGSKDIYLSNLANQSYTSEHDSYNATGALTAQTRAHQDGSLASSYALATDGTTTTNTYDSLGVLTSDVVVYVNGTIDTKSYTGAVLTGETVKYGAGLTNLSDVRVFNVAGQQTLETIVHADGSRDVYQSAVVNQNYVTGQDTFNASGILTAETRQHADGTLASTYTLAADGTRTTNTYNATGVLVSNVVYRTDGSSDTKTYSGTVLSAELVRYATGAYDSKTYTGTVLTGEIIKFAPGSADGWESKVFNTAGVLTADTVMHANGSQDVYYSNIANRSYVSQHDVYNTAGILTAETQLHQDGSLALTYALGSDGTKTTNTYGATGNLVSSLAIHADGSSDSRIYTGAVLTAETQRHADGSLAWTYAVAADGTTTTDTYNAAGVLVSVVVTHPAVSSVATTYAAASSNETVQYASGAYHSETYTGTVMTAEIITFAPGSADGWESKVFNTAGALTGDTVVHTNNSQDVYYSNITNRSYASQHDVYNTAGTLVAETRLHQDGSLASTFVLGSDGTRATNTYDATGNLLSDVVVHTDGSADTKTYTGNVLTGETVNYAPGSAEAFDTKAYNSAGVLIQENAVHANHSEDVYLYDIANRSYVSQHDVYSTAGVLAAETRLHLDGSLASTYALASDGTKTTNSYNASGVLQSDVVAHTDGSSDSKTYTGAVLTAETVRYTAGSADLIDTKTYNAAGALTNDTVIHADHSEDVYDTNVTGQSYVADHFAYDPTGKLLTGDVTNVNGSHTQTAYAAGVTLNATPAVASTFNTYASGSDTFNFKPGFGNDTVSGFHAGAGANHDTLAIDITEAADFQHLQLQTVGHDTLITLSASDSILLKGVAAGSLTAQDFHFVHYDLHA